MRSVVCGVGAGLVTAMLLTVCAVWAITPAQSTTEPSQTNMPSIGARSGPLPPTVYGYTFAVDGGTPLSGCTVAITEEATGEVVVWDESREEWDPTLNVYAIWMGEFMDGWTYGDVLNVTAKKGALIGWNEAQITATDNNLIEIDVTLDADVFIMNLVKGWNFVSLPLVGYGYKASTLGLNSGDIVSEWNSTTKSYRSHIVGIPVNDFAISPGTGYEIYVPSGTRTLALYGIVPTASQSKTITAPAGGGWAAVGFVGFVTTRHASDIPAMYSVPGSITMVSTWNPITKTYTNWLAVIPSLNDFVLTPGLAYWAYASTSGTLAYDPVVRPVASFTYSVSGSTVYVNASASSDDHGIVDYEWDWGDGTTGTGVTATHTYSTARSVPADSGYTLSGRGRTTHPIIGYTYAADGVTALNDCDLFFTNMRTGESFTYKEEPGYNVYVVDASQFTLRYLIGDLVNVTAVKGTAFGWTVAPLTDSSNGYDWIDVVLAGVLEPIEKTVTLTVTDTIGRTDSVSQTVALFAPPIALFTYTVNNLTVNVDASLSIGYGIVSYVWDWGDGTTGTGVTAGHGYAVAGTHKVTLTVTDNTGLSESASKSIPAPPAPPGPP